MTTTLAMWGWMAKGPIDAVVVREIVPHGVVLDDVTVEMRRDHAFADRMVPAGDVADQREVEATRGDDIGDGRLHLEVAEHDRRALGPQPLEQRVRHVPQW